MQEFNTFSQPLLVLQPQKAFICYMCHPTTASVQLLHVYKSPDHGKCSAVKALVYKPFRPSG